MDKILNQMESIEHNVSKMLEKNDTFQMLKDELRSLLVGLFVSVIGLAAVGTLVFWVLK
ncbi:MAG: hypothetical protein LBL42_06335 [Tannerella sp.]|jgi:integral membrane sensor domain MASE1|nr:hypothetical protein [Tannerella sp.]